jgi:hypothetical protein
MLWYVLVPCTLLFLTYLYIDSGAKRPVDVYNLSLVFPFYNLRGVAPHDVLMASSSLSLPIVWRSGAEGDAEHTY